MRIVIIIFLLCIFASLGSALYYMVTDREGGRRMARALAMRVGPSLTLFILLMLGYYFGILPGR